jgi:hypothetical protein
MKRYKFLDPEMIMSVIIALIVFSVGIFAFFVTVTNLPVAEQSSNRLGGVTAEGTAVDFNTTEYVTVSSAALNSTTPCILSLYNSTTAAWSVVQAAGACNGTFMSNNTYRITAGTSHYTGHGASDRTTWKLSYTTVVSPTSTLQNRTFSALTNASETGESVFNIVGVILIIGAIMTIIGLVYSYMRPRY